MQYAVSTHLSVYQDVKSHPFTVLHRDVANTSSTIHWEQDQGSSWLNAHSTRWAWDDRCTGEIYPFSP